MEERIENVYVMNNSGLSIKQAGTLNLMSRRAGYKE
jgi:hypothetical protein